MSRDSTTVRAKLSASGEVFSLTVESATSLDGNILKQSVAAPEISVVPRAPATPNKVNRQSDRNSPLIVNGQFTAAAIEEYRAIHATVKEVQDRLATTQDPGLWSRPHLLWRHIVGVEITNREYVETADIYENQYPGRLAKTLTARLMEYLKIKLAYPEKTVEETLAIYAESVKSGIVKKIRTDLLDEKWGMFFIK